jgi:predicted helicase
VNIESVFGSLNDGKYEPFEGLVLTDTFQMFESKDKMDDLVFLDNNEKVTKQKRTDIRVVIGNPPYSKGQSDANQANPNMKYPDLDESIRDTYVRHSKSANSNSSYDTYFKAFRWATNRIKDKGVVCFVSNGSWIDSNSADGFRKSLGTEFSKAYVFNLRGNARTLGEQRRKEAGNVFGEGSRTAVAITLLIKNPKHKGEIEVFYYDIGDYLSREEKLRIVRDFKSLEGIPWESLRPNKHGDWINQRDEIYSTFIPLSDKTNKGRESQAIFKMFSMGIRTNRDAWTYNFNREKLLQNVNRMIKTFIKFQLEFSKGRKTLDEVTRASKKEISWSRGLLDNLKKGKSSTFEKDELILGIYRPFQKIWLYKEKFFMEMRYQTHLLFPNNSGNLVIHATGLGSSVDFSVLMTDTFPDHHFMANGQIFPLYYYAELSPSEEQNALFAPDESNSQIHAVSDWALTKFKDKYKKNLSKEDIFYYVYGILSSPEYRKRFRYELKKDVIRVPLLEEFDVYCEFGRKLSTLHLNYENFENTLCVVEITESNSRMPELYKVGKMRYGKNDDRTVLIFNQFITIRNIPQDIFDYTINGKSPLDWVVDRYQVKEDSDSGIVNDPNEFSTNPRYVFNLVLSVIEMTNRILELENKLPKLVIPDNY